MRKTQTRQAAKDLENRVCTHLLLGVFSVGIVSPAAPTALAQDCDTDQNPVVYDSSGDVLPHDITVPGQDWQTLCGGTQGEEDFGTITDGILTIVDDSTSQRASYCKSSMFLRTCDGEQEAVYEFSTDVISTTPPIAWVPELAFICGMRDVENDFRVAVTEDEGVGFFDGSDWLTLQSVEQRVAVNWSSGPHLFRIEKDADEVRLYMNNEANASVTVARADLVNNAVDNRADLAVTSTPGKATFELTLFRYRVGTTSFDNGDPDCVADIDDDGDVDAADLLLLLRAWGPCTDCDEDLDDDDEVGASDLLILLASWGSCP